MKVLSAAVLMSAGLILMESNLAEAFFFDQMSRLFGGGNKISTRPSYGTPSKPSYGVPSKPSYGGQSSYKPSQTSGGALRPLYQSQVPKRPADNNSKKKFNLDVFGIFNKNKKGKQTNAGKPQYAAPGKKPSYLPGGPSKRPYLPPRPGSTFRPRPSYLPPGNRPPDNLPGYQPPGINYLPDNNYRPPVNDLPGYNPPRPTYRPPIATTSNYFPVFPSNNLNPIQHPSGGFAPSINGDFNRPSIQIPTDQTSQGLGGSPSASPFTQPESPVAPAIGGSPSASAFNQPDSSLATNVSNDVDSDFDLANPEPSSAGDGWVPMPISMIMEMFSWPQKQGDQTGATPLAGNSGLVSQNTFKTNLKDDIASALGSPQSDKDIFIQNVILPQDRPILVQNVLPANHQSFNRVKQATIQVAAIDGNKAPVLVKPGQGGLVDEEGPEDLSIDGPIPPDRGSLEPNTTESPLTSISGIQSNRLVAPEATSSFDVGNNKSVAEPPSSANSLQATRAGKAILLQQGVNDNQLEVNVLKDGFGLAFNTTEEHSSIISTSASEPFQPPASPIEEPQLQEEHPDPENASESPALTSLNTFVTLELNDLEEPTTEPGFEYTEQGAGLFREDVEEGPTTPPRLKEVQAANWVWRTKQEDIPLAALVEEGEIETRIPKKDLSATLDKDVDIANKEDDNDKNSVNKESKAKDYNCAKGDDVNQVVKAGDSSVRGVGQLVDFYPIHGKPFVSFIPSVEYSSFS